MEWTEYPNDDMRRPLFRNALGWILYFWQGHNLGWVICRPDERVWLRSQNFTKAHITEAQSWATDAINRQIGNL